VHVGQRLPDRLAHGALVLGVQEREQQADRHGLDLGLAQRVDRLAHAAVVERLDLPVGAHPLAHAEAQLARDERLGPALGQRVERRAVLAPDLDHVAKPGRRDEPGAGAAALEQRVGRDGHPVRERAGLLDPRGLEAVHNALGLVAGRGGHLPGDETTVDERHEVGERSPDVHPEPCPALHRRKTVKSLVRALSERPPVGRV
jgi:hypothetical protein